MSTESMLVVAFSALVVVYAALRGCLPERWCAGVIFTGVIIDELVEAAFGARSFEGFEPSRLLLDLMQFVVFLTVALRANRLYPLGIAAAQLLSIMGSISALVVPHGWNQAYWAMTQLPLFLQLQLLALGTLAHQQRVARVGNYNCWSPTYNSRERTT